jgi:hypothetical protein
MATWLAGNTLPEALLLSRDAFEALAEPRQLEGARRAQRWLHELEAELGRRLFALRDLHISRRLRLSVVGLIGFVLAALLVAFGVRLYRGPDLAYGKPWRASSSAETCEPKRGVCAGAYTEVFFITNEENNPWLEIDLLSRQGVSRIEVDNRRDSGSDRAIPLVVELSEDGQKYFTVAQRVEPFTSWSAAFTRQSARYVRVSVPRRTTLSLERVSVRP